MTNKLCFEIETDASYTKDEKAEILDAFVAWYADVDGDAIEGTEDVSIVDTNNIPDESVKKREIIEELLKGMKIEYQVQARFSNEEDEVVGESVSATGFLK